MDKKAIKTYQHLNFDNYPEPDSLKDAHVGLRGLIIGSGPSSGKLLSYVDRIRDKFDVVMSMNFAIKDFQDYSDYFIVMENKPTRLARWVRKHIVNEDLVYILNSKSVRFFDSRLKIVKADRTSCKDNPNIREYSGGLFDGFSTMRVGTSVVIQALHMMGIFGCKSVHMCGVELFFTDAKYYYEKKNRITHKDANRMKHPDLKQEEIEFKGKKYWSVPVFYKSALSANKLITGEFKKNNIEVSDFSKGLITEAKQVDIDEFFMEKK